MDAEFQELEDTLKGLRPAAPDAVCMERLLAAVESRLAAADPSVERDLSRLTPVPLDPGAAVRMLETVSRVPFAVDEKVVLFPGPSKPAEKGRDRRSWIAAAAAVAVLGAFSAVMMESPDAPSRSVAEGGPVPRITSPASGFIPASVGSGVQDAKDEGVMWTPDGKPMRMVRVIYMDRVKYLNEAGKIIEVERPRVEYLMVPEKID
jgi:hypothetical protein